VSEVAGTVVEVRDGQAIVRCQSEPAGCALCAGGRGCSWRRVVGSHTLAIPLACADGQLRAGDLVSLTVDDARLLGAAARLYLPPLLGVLGAPALLRLLTTDTGLPSLLAALAGLFGGFVAARRWTRRMPAVRVARSTGRIAAAPIAPSPPAP
jgi:positive regulator of sigma E activity